MSRASHYCKEFGNFSGAAHVIPPNADNMAASSIEPPFKTREPPHLHHRPLSRPCQTPLSHDKTRESARPASQLHDKAREQSSSIDFDDPTFAPISTIPTTSEFCIPCTPSVPVEDPSIATTRRKQLRLLTIHESLGHLSFTILRSMARCGIIPKELSTVDPPICPGCAYGKAHRLQWRYKDSKNVKSI